MSRPTSNDWPGLRRDLHPIIEEFWSKVGSVSDSHCGLGPRGRGPSHRWKPSVFSGRDGGLAVRCT